MLGSLLRQIFGARRASAPASPPDLGKAYAHMSEGRPGEAAALFEAALAAQPHTTALLNDLGLCYVQSKRYFDAERKFQDALRLDAHCTPARANLGNLYLQLEDPARAEEEYRRALEDAPEDASLWNHLALCLRNAGCADESVECSRRALQLAPRDESFRSNLLFTLLFSRRATARDLFEEARSWAALGADSLTDGAAPHGNLPDPERPLRIGYVSADLREHAVASFIEPLLARHDKDRFDVTCYHNHTVEDGQSARLRQLAKHWRNVAALSDEDFARQVRDDRIDLLVDLSGHTNGNRLSAFARKPAPLQFTYLGFPGSTGIRAIDYRLTDAVFDPPDSDASLYVEKLLRLPDSLWCFRPLGDFAEPSPSPVLARGAVTFGSFNGFHKLTPELLEEWAGLLQRVPQSRLLMVTVPEGGCRARVVDIFEHAGVGSERLSLHGRVPRNVFRALQSECDIALDGYPCGGGATTCDVLWMGLPVITRSGATPVSRAGASLLTTLGLRELIAHDADEFIDIAARLAADPPRIEALRQGMRARMRASPLMQEEAFTRTLESAYRQAWRGWCENRR
jgi:protein O-GlcNAc transferase